MTLRYNTKTIQRAIEILSYKTESDQDYRVQDRGKLIQKFN